MKYKAEYIISIILFILLFCGFVFGVVYYYPDTMPQEESEIEINNNFNTENIVYEIGQSMSPETGEFIKEEEKMSRFLP